MARLVSVLRNCFTVILPSRKLSYTCALRITSDSNELNQLLRIKVRSGRAIPETGEDVRVRRRWYLRVQKRTNIKGKKVSTEIFLEFSFPQKKG